MIDPGYAPQKAGTRWGLWLLGGIGALILAGFLAWFISANAKESGEIEKMIAIADSIPSEGDWQLVTNAEPRHDVGCIPFDNSCHSLLRSWEPPDLIGIDELVETTGYDLEVQTVAREDCAVGWVVRVHLELCSYDRKVSLRMFDR